MSEIDHREDWLIRWLHIKGGATTTEVLEARQRMGYTETKAQTTTILKKLEKAGYLSSAKDGRELRWETTGKGEDVIA